MTSTEILALLDAERAKQDSELLALLSAHIHAMEIDKRQTVEILKGLAELMHALDRTLVPLLRQEQTVAFTEPDEDAWDFC